MLFNQLVEAPQVGQHDALCNAGECFRDIPESRIDENLLALGDCPEGQEVNAQRPNLIDVELVCQNCCTPSRLQCECQSNRGMNIPGTPESWEQYFQGLNVTDFTTEGNTG